jgi:nucleoside-diphosphate-sugar epimerase
MRAGCSAAASVRCRPWRCWVIGGHGQVGLRLLRLLARDGHRGRGVIRKAEQAGDLAAADAEAVLSDHPLLTWT